MLIQPARCSNTRTPNLLAGIAALLAATTFHCPDAVAADNYPDYSLNGFGTLGAAYSSLDDADFIGNQVQLDGVGRTRSWATSTDSKLGLQLNAHFNPQLSAILQVVAQYDYEGKYHPNVEWAYLDFQATSDLTIRLGRVVVSAFLESETRQVGYTYLWVRPPPEIYAINPFTSRDGIDIQYRFSTGAVFNSVQLSYGGDRKELRDDFELNANPALDLQYIAESGPTKVRLAYSSSDVDVNQPGITSLFDGMAQYGAAVPGPAGEQALFNANRFRGIGSRIETLSAGIKYEPDRWLLQAEWVRTQWHGPAFFSDADAWYLTVGYHLAQVTPYLTLAHLQSDRLANTPIPTEGLPPGLDVPAVIFNGALDSLLDATAPSQKRVEAGVRWNFNPNAALKLQVEHLRSEAPSSGFLTNLGPSFTPGDSTNVFSVTMDFVF